MAESRIALLAIIVQNPDSVGALNDILHEYRGAVIGRMGLPYREKGLSLISVALDAPESQINALAGKVGSLEGVSSKTVYPKAE